MQGVAKYTKCACGSERAYPKYGKCRACVATGSFRKYQFNAETDDAIRAAYSEAESRQDLSRRIANVADRYGWRRHVVTYRGQMLGLSSGFRNPWTEKDRGYLLLHSGTKSLQRIAEDLHRSYESVKAQASALNLKTKVWAGYSYESVGQILGVGKVKLREWEKAGWFTLDIERRITQAALERLLRDHLDAIDLRRVDQAWLRETLSNMLAGTRPDTAAGYDMVASPSRLTWNSSPDAVVQKRLRKAA